MSSPGAGFGLIDAALYAGVDPTWASDSTAGLAQAISDAAAAAVPLKVYLRAGLYRVTAPLTLPSGVTLAGPHGNVFDPADYGATIKPDASWAQGTAATAAVLCIGGSGGASEVAVTDLNIDGSELMATADGIQPGSASSNVLIRDVRIQACTNDGLSSGSASCNTWRCVRVMSRQNGRYGFGVGFDDSDFTDCEAFGNSSSGFYAYDPINCKFSGCRAEWNSGQGFYITGDEDATGMCSFTGCSTDRNTQNGFVADSTGNWPIIVTGLMLRRDGAGSVSGGFAGFAVTSECTSPVIVDGMAVMPGYNDDGTGNGSPEYGIVIDGTPTYVSVTNALAWGVSGGVNGTISNFRALATQTGQWDDPAGITQVSDSA